MVDAHAIVRHGLGWLVAGAPGMRLVGQASTSEEAVELVRRERPELVVLGLNLSGADAMELVRKLAEAGGRSRVLVVGIYDETIFAERCLRYGASGYLRKDADTETLLQAMEAVLAGEIYVGDGVRKQIPTRLSGGRMGLKASPLSLLTDRQMQVFRLLGMGRSTREVASHLDLSVKTIETHRAKIMKKLGLANATQLVHRAIEWTRTEEESG